MENLKNYRHYTGKYWSAEHSICNLPFREKNFIPVLPSNVSAYDYYLIAPKIAEKFKECNLLHVGENLSLS